MMADEIINDAQRFSGEENEHALQCTSNCSTTRGALLGSVVHSIALGVLQVVEEAAIIYNVSTGVIESLVDLRQLTPAAQEALLASCTVIDDQRSPGKLLVPGFIDAHFHAPQYVFAGTGNDLPLLAWLETYTFPAEARFSDVRFAQEAYERCVSRLLDRGTTCVSYFGTVHRRATELLAQIAMQRGQRALVGKVCMDRHAPDTLCEETEQSAQETEQFVRSVLGMTSQGLAMIQRHDQTAGQPAEDMQVVSSFVKPVDHHVKKTKPVHHVIPPDAHSSLFEQAQALPLVVPVITPRFVPSCTSPLMHQLGHLAKAYSLPVQSHLSESEEEIAWVASLHPDCTNYLDVYIQHGLAGQDRVCYMAHCVHSSELERHMMAGERVGVVHCPASNFQLESGICDVRTFLDSGVMVGVGTDVAGGASCSMLDALRQTLTASRALSFQHRRRTVEDRPARSHTESRDTDVLDYATDSPTVTVETRERESLASTASSASAYRPLSLAEAFHLCTVGSAQVLGLGNCLGNLLPGKKLDALVVNLVSEDSPVDFFEETVSVETYFEKFLTIGDDRNVRKVYVDGKCVLEKK